MTPTTPPLCPQCERNLRVAEWNIKGSMIYTARCNTRGCKFWLTEGLGDTAAEAVEHFREQVQQSK